MVNQGLIDFLVNSLRKGHSEDFLRKGLIKQKWPIYEVDQSMNQAKIIVQPRLQLKEIKKPSEPKKESIVTPRIKPWKLVLMAVIIFIILGFTVMVFFYMNAIVNYKVYDPTTGAELIKTCLYQDCFDMRENAINTVKDSITTLDLFNPLLWSLIAAILLTLWYKLTQYKRLYLWILNVSYLIVLVILIVRWFLFIK